MKGNSFSSVVKRGDYSFELLKEISHDISSLPKYSGNISKHLASIDRKLDRARDLGINVSRYERKLLDFRKIVVLRDIKFLMEKIDNNPKFAFSDTTDITGEFNELKRELKESKLLNTDEKVEFFFDVHKKHKLLQEKITRIRIKHMILDIKDRTKTPLYTIERVTDEIMKAKARGIEVDDLMDMLLE